MSISGAAEHLLEEAAGQLVVLQIRVGAVDGDRAGLQPGDQFHQMTLLRLGAALILLGQAFAQQPPDAVSNQESGSRPRSSRRMDQDIGIGRAVVFMVAEGWRLACRRVRKTA
jgi:hypothetical protein